MKAWTAGTVPAVIVGAIIVYLFAAAGL